MDREPLPDGILDLPDAIELLRDQVVQAQLQASPAGIKFLLEEVTVELAAELVKTTSGGGGLRFAVVSADAKLERSSRNSHKVTVRMRPRTATGGDVEVSDDDDD
ncbi:hypothetical protein ETD83_04850 [Actinomadura soli]|uniref:Trypsin-co-occurring domain-containing protein n=1 Tax=Actinomadura soli TaxID=2508997 RepID=A0A5C4JIR0_9ACTN|nr:trypco2 family protein [Actinomadura soli]TMR06425.1 hypothetical protein ETD83_04850 [Actinomadura soli]